MGSSILRTDGYKFSMAEAGFPLREETFYYTHRRGGAHYLPVDIKSYIKGILPKYKNWHEQGYEALDRFGYKMGGAFKMAFDGDADELIKKLKIRSLPKGSWFFDREPVFTVTGPSAIVSWLEPLILRLNYRIQIATEAILRPETLSGLFENVASGEDEQIIKETLACLNIDCPEITIQGSDYTDEVKLKLKELIEIVGTPNRIFEVGMRGVSGQTKHQMALIACKKVGVMATSNVYYAESHGMKAVGTMGHEHCQRYGSDDEAFRAMRDRFAGSPSYLLDTYSTIKSGIPTALNLMAETPDRNATMRFDSGDIESQYLIACSMAKAKGVKARYILEDGFTAERTMAFEKLREYTGISPEDQLYGFGGYIVNSKYDKLTRDRVAAVWKLTQSGGTPTMKFGDEPGAGKESIPGKPILYRPNNVFDVAYCGAVGYVAQEGEEISDSWSMITMNESAHGRFNYLPEEINKILSIKKTNRPLYSTNTQQMVDKLYVKRKLITG